MAENMIKRARIGNWLMAIGVVVAGNLICRSAAPAHALGIVPAILVVVVVGGRLRNVTWKRMLTDSIDTRTALRRTLIVSVGECAIATCFTLGMVVFDPIAASIPAVWLIVMLPSTVRLYRAYGSETPGVFCELKDADVSSRS